MAPRPASGTAAPTALYEAGILAMFTGRGKEGGAGIVAVAQATASLRAEPMRAYAENHFATHVGYVSYYDSLDFRRWDESMRRHVDKHAAETYSKGRQVVRRRVSEGEEAGGVEARPGGVGGTRQGRLAGRGVATADGSESMTG